MGKRSVAAALGIAVMMVGTSSASAAVEVGNDCTGNNPAAVTFVQTARATPSAFPLTVPSAGVVTAWKVRSAAPAAYTERLKVFRATTKPNQFTTVGESAFGTVVQGTNVFNAQIPVQPGDRFGAFGGPPSPSGAAIYCGTANGGDLFGTVATDPTVGSSTEFAPGAGILVAISAVVEPDADGDGAGDETQDKCPRSAKLQTECPPITLSSFGIAAKNSALVLVASSSAAPVTVSATVTVPGKTKKGKKGKKGKAKLLTLSGPTQPVGPGELSRFVISYSVPLKAALTALSPKRSLALNVTTSATDLAGQPSSTGTTLRLKGQAKRK